MKAVLDRADWTEPQWLENWEADCRHLGLTVSEFIQWEQMPVEQAAEFVTVQGEEHIRQALRTGRGVMILAAHLGNYFSCALANRRLGLDVCSAVRPMSVRSLEERVRKFMRGCRIQHVLIGDRLPARAAETFRRGAAFLVFVDSTLPKTRNVWVRLGGAETHVSLGPALLAIRHRVPVICLTSARVDTVRHCVTFHPPLPVTRSGDFRADATRLTQHAMDVITEGVRQWPAQWCPWDIAPIRA